MTSGGSERWQSADKEKAFACTEDSVGCALFCLLSSAEYSSVAFTVKELRSSRLPLHSRVNLILSFFLSLNFILRINSQKNLNFFFFT